MKLGLIMPQYGAFASKRAISAMAVRAEENGFDSIWVADHMIVPHGFEDRFSDHFYEAFTTLGYLAGITSRVSLGTTVIVLPYRHPVALAKQIATLDQLSDGRSIMGVAFGWSEDEYQILDVPFAYRGRRADEMLRICDHLWAEGSNAFRGEFYQFDDFHFQPKPVQRPRPPIWIGGNDERALARTAKFGDGWHPITSAKRPGSVQWTLADLTKRLARLDELAEQAGRDPRTIERSLCTPLAFDVDPEPYIGEGFGLVGSEQQIIDHLSICKEIGIEHLVISFWYTIADRVSQPDTSQIDDEFSRFVERIQAKI